MKIVEIYFLFILFISLSCCNHKNTSEHIPTQPSTFLDTQLRKADSIVLISHNKYYGFIEEGVSAPIDSLSLIIKGKLNLSIIHEFIKIEIDHELVELLTEKRKDSVIRNNACFLPRHAILAYFGNAISYLDISFTCEGWQSSDDPLFSRVYISKDSFGKWKDYFFKKGIRYFPEIDE